MGNGGWVDALRERVVVCPLLLGSADSIDELAEGDSEVGPQVLVEETEGDGVDADAAHGEPVAAEIGDGLLEVRLMAGDDQVDVEGQPAYSEDQHREHEQASRADLPPDMCRLLGGHSITHSPGRPQLLADANVRCGYDDEG